MVIPLTTMSKENSETDVAKDPGSMSNRPTSETDVEGHRVFHGYGVHVPGSGARRRPGSGGSGGHRRHKRNGSKRSKDSEDESESELMRPSDRVHFILGEDDTDGGHESHPLFSEMAELVSNNEEMEWRETARWIKFEEDVEEGGNRWSKPHVGTISLHSLFELRSCILNGTVLLDLEASSLDQIADLMLESMVQNNQLSADVIPKVKDALLRRHRHQHERRHGGDSKNRLPIIRSLADIGRNSSRSMFGSHRSLDKILSDVPPSSSSTATITTTTSSPATASSHPLPTSTTTTTSYSSPTSPIPSGIGGGHLSSLSTSSTTVSAQQQHFKGKNTLGVPARKGANISAHSDSSMPQSPSAHSLQAQGSDGQHLSGSGASSTDLQHKLNQGFMRKIPHGSEADNILVGEIDCIDHSIAAFIRLKNACYLGDLTEVPVPTRFLFVLLGPHSIPGRYHEVGRAMATLMSDDVFHDVAYKSKSRDDLLAGVDEFLDAVTILPPGAWDPSIRIEPPVQVPSQETRKKPQENKEPELDSEEEEELERERSGLKRSGRIFGGLVNDIKRKYPWYLSDFTDAFVLQSVASIFFLYFACLTPIITFGGLLGDATGNNIATMESLLTGAICGIMYGLFSGQPLTILGSTGPVLVFETILYDFCRRHDLHYLNIRLWIGLWMAFFLLVMVALDYSALVCYITRFTEENFATLISVIFIFKAFENLFHIGKEYPVDRHPDIPKNYLCNCSIDGEMYELQRTLRNETALKECKILGGTLVGDGCMTPTYLPNVFLFSCILFTATYAISVFLKEFKTAPFFSTKVRQIISDFAVVIAIASMTAFDMWVHVPTPKLFVPAEFKPTRDDRGWLVPFFHEKNPVWLIPLCCIPACFSTILIFMDQQITAVIINRKEYRLKKGCGYHLDLFILCILVAIASVMGLPWFVAATVLAMTHVNSLKVESQTSAPGEKPQFLGVLEQRVTNIIIFLLCGLSVFFTPLLKHIPMPVLFGVFLYMGTSSLKGSQFFERILIIFMPQKYQPDYIFLRHVPTWKVHIFTLIQLLCFALLWAVKSYKKISIMFPLMLLVIVIVRKLLDFVFTRQELKILDDIMPESTKRKKIEEKELLKKNDDDSSAPGGGGVVGGVGTVAGATAGLVPNTSSGNVTIPLANGNVLKIPVNKIGTEEEKEPDINITEQLSKSNAWRSINHDTNGTTKTHGKPPTNATNGQKKKNRVNKKDAKSDEEQKRLSTMREEDDEEDCGITIKVDAPTPVPTAISSPKDESSNSNETPV
ncbi:na[+]-driven anion exchanger 1 isoform X3 [Dermatophagoides farinae]|uniref:na[+]-driven anion exchanger 1 isoform X3 n=1 Tax=Dermatophagoides farinae TaxID=6954 RepID=UPI001F111F1F|nr:sodium-driven chloride bicarbonate exchanger-like isoform X3 [Dermatophagoides farinae]